MRKQNHAIICQPRTSFQRYFMFKLCFLNGNLCFFLSILNLLKKKKNNKKTEQLPLELFLNTTSNKQNISIISKKKKNDNNCS